MKRAKETNAAWVIVDTAGRFQIDDTLMEELKEVKKAISPAETLLVVDAMTGQDAVQAAQEFHDRIGITGLVLTKMDGDARGGAALSITSVTGVPIKFIGTGERTEALEQVPRKGPAQEPHTGPAGRKYYKRRPCGYPGRRRSKAGAFSAAAVCHSDGVSNMKASRA